MASSSNPVKPLEQQTQKTSKDAMIRNPETAKTYTFSFKVRPAILLKQALEALTDEEFYKEGSAMIEVLHTGVGITVRNVEHDVLGILILKATGLLNFDVVKPMKRKMINLKRLSRLLEAIGDDVAVTVYHSDGYNQLKIKAEERSYVVTFGVDLHEFEPQLEKFPGISYDCTCDIRNTFLSELLALVKATTSKLVLVEISESCTEFFVGRDALAYDYDPEKGVCKGLEKGQIHRFRFTLPHCKALEKAMPLAKKTLVGFTTDPGRRVVFLFKLAGLGELYFFKETTALAAIMVMPITPTDQTQAGTEAIG